MNKTPADLFPILDTCMNRADYLAEPMFWLLEEGYLWPSTVSTFICYKLVYSRRGLQLRVVRTAQMIRTADSDYAVTFASPTEDRL